MATVSFTHKGLLELIRYYIRETGVRNLEREIASLCRKIAFKTARGRARRFTIRPQQVGELLGVRRFHHGNSEEHDCVGVVTGLAWTETGGELLNVEAVVLQGKGTLTITASTEM